jgi:hypothetical protein
MLEFVRRDLTEAGSTIQQTSAKRRSLVTAMRLGSISLPTCDNLYTYTPGMSRYVMEHLPRATATYDVNPVNSDQAKLWLEQSAVISAVRTTEMITAIKAGMDVDLAPSPSTVAIRPGEEVADEPVGESL